MNHIPEVTILQTMMSKTERGRNRGREKECERKRDREVRAGRKLGTLVAGNVGAEQMLNIVWLNRNHKQLCRCVSHGAPIHSLLIKNKITDTKNSLTQLFPKKETSEFFSLKNYCLLLTGFSHYLQLFRDNIFPSIYYLRYIPSIYATQCIF